MICEYGCGRKAQYIFKNGKRCCSQSHNSCIALRKKNSKSNKGRVVPEKTKRQISKTLKNKKQVKEKNPNWKGGYDSKNIPLYDTYALKLSFVEEVRRSPKDPNILEVRCTNCKSWYIPTAVAVYNRVAVLKGQQGGENRFYCSNKCKKICSIYGKVLYQENHPRNKKLYTQEEYETFRQFVLERDDYKCQYCDDPATIVHHERPQKLEPFFALDPDFAWSCCEKCHYEKGHKTGTECSTGNLAKMIC